MPVSPATDFYSEPGIDQKNQPEIGTQRTLQDQFGRPIAGGLARLAAFAIDCLILDVASSIALYLLIGSNFSFNPDTGKVVLHNTYPASFWLAFCLIVVANIAYFTFMNGSPKGQTLGKMVMRISVRDVRTGASIGQAMALLRIVLMGVFFVAYLVPLVLDFVWLFFEPMRRTWHDLASRSIVVRV